MNQFNSLSFKSWNKPYPSERKPDAKPEDEEFANSKENPRTAADMNV